MYYEHYYGGMNFIWWAIWIIMLFWIFAIPYKIPGQRNQKDSPLDILKKRYVSGKINLEEYEEMKKNLK
jgi:putative membrane protein|nr:SHOCT domain-containing protein [uncultured Flavobacterium sp.]